MLGTSRILEKGPEYLRKQMEREREATGRVSAAERLAATKINYVRSPQVSSPSSHNPCTGPGSASSPQVSSVPVQNPPTRLVSTRSPQVSSPPVQNPPTRLVSTRSPQVSSPPVRNPPTRLVSTRSPQVSSPPVRNPPTRLVSTRSPQVSSPSVQNPPTRLVSTRNPQVSSAPVQNPPTRLVSTRSPQVSSPSVQDPLSGPSALGCQQKLNSRIPPEIPTSTSPVRSMRTVRPPAGKEPGTTPGKANEFNRSEPASSKTADGGAGNDQEQVTEGNIVKRNSSKKRPDSILLYRQKCELQRGSGNTVRRLFLNSLKEKSRGTKSENKLQLVQIRVFDEDGADTGADEDDPPRDDFEGGLEPERARKAVGRSHSDISSRYSKNFGDFDTFFTYCGLEEDVVQSLGRENFSSRSDELSLSYAKIRSVSVATSDGEHSHTSGDIDGLHEEEVKETRQQGSSVIERNARVIKWLYSCKNASQSGKTLRDLD